MDIRRKEKSKESTIESAFLKNDTKQFDIDVNVSQILKIKLEVDTQPVLGFHTENKVSPVALFLYDKMLRNTLPLRRKDACIDLSQMEKSGKGQGLV